jgi:hypothetical protein
MKITIIYILLSLLLLNSCNKDNESINYFSFKINGQKKEYKSFMATDNFLKKGFTSIIACESGNIPSQQFNKFNIYVKINNQQKFNLNDSLLVTFQGHSLVDIYAAPKIYYDFSISSPNPDSLIVDKVSTNFSLTIDTYDTIKNVISGYFSGLLRNAYYQKSDSLVITDGKFKIQLSQE